MILSKLFSFSKRAFNYFQAVIFSKPFEIIDERIISKSVFSIKEKTVERIFFPPVFGLSEGGMLDFFSDALTIKKIESATIYYGSDFVTKDTSAFWKKYFLPQWQKIIPSDAFLFKIKGEHIYIKKARVQHTVNVAFSLLGVHSHTWTHFLFQYFSKLLYIQNVLDLEHSVTIVHPIYSDPQVNYIFKSFTRHFKNISFLPIKNGDTVFCKSLYHINNTSQISDHANYITPSDIIIPEFVLHKIKNNLISFLAESVEIKKQQFTNYKKIYLGRVGQRNLLNSDEIESFFISKGFKIVYPDKFSLHEKYMIFKNADVIVGPGSSAFSNIIFSKPGTKVLAFSNYQRLCDALSYYKYFGICFVMVNDKDVDQTIHSNYSISLEKLELSYNYLLEYSVR
jgi:hypothetical protein